MLLVFFIGCARIRNLRSFQDGLVTTHCLLGVKWLTWLPWVGYSFDCHTTSPEYKGANRLWWTSNSHVNQSSTPQESLSTIPGLFCNGRQQIRALTNWQMMCQPTCFYWYEKAPTAHLPASLQLMEMLPCAAKLVISSHNTCNTGLPLHPVLFLLRLYLETVCRQPYQKVVNAVNHVKRSLMDDSTLPQISGNQTVSSGSWACILPQSPSIIRHMLEITAH